ncbi:hypothetical protein QZH41_015366 [Actinostola sp. cb2023]|nr:hypothetical protein QZH41_015366 [Actinostola sp. cb2023]
MADEHESQKVEDETSNNSELTANQKKNKKKKEAAKRKKQEQREKNEASNKQDGTASQETMSPEAKLEEELAWCIGQLEIGLKVQTPEKNTANHTEHLIKNLKSPKVPLPKKRQIMHSVFGDYRKKMQEDVKKCKPKEKSLKVFPVKKDQQRSVFVRVSQDKGETNSKITSDSRQGDEIDQPSEASKSTEWKFESSVDNFRFNFDIQPT